MKKNQTNGKLPDAKQSAKRNDILFIVCLLLPSVILTLWQTYYPVVKGMGMAFQSYNIANLSKTHFVGFENFRELFEVSSFNAFLPTIKNTIFYVFGSLIPQVTLGFILAMLLKRKFPGRSVYQGFIFVPWALSGFIIGIMWRWMFNGTGGVINDLLMRLGVVSEPVAWLSSKQIAPFAVVVANVWYGIPFFTIMITAALQGVPLDLYEAASMDGANAVTQFFVVTLPHIKSVLILTTLLRFIWIFNDPSTIYSMTAGGPAGSTQIMTSYMYTLITNLDYGKASAVGVICMLIMIVYTLFYLAITNFASED